MSLTEQQPALSARRLDLVTPIEQLQKLIINEDARALSKLLELNSACIKAFQAEFKTSDGQELIKTAASRIPEPQLNEFARSQIAQEFFAELTVSALEFLDSVSLRLHPGHDLRHVIFKDPLTAFNIIQNTELQAYEQLSFVAGLLHDSGRAIELVVDQIISGGVIGNKHAEYSFLVFSAAANSALVKLQPKLSPADSEIIGVLLDELKNAVLDHETGNSRLNASAQIVQSADRLQLVGFEMVQRAVCFDVGVKGAKILPNLKEEYRYRLPLPGTADANDYNLLQHLEFYARNLFPNYGSFAESSTRDYQMQSCAFIMQCLIDEQELAALPEILTGDLAEIPDLFMQSFFPEIIAYRRELNLELPAYNAKLLENSNKKEIEPQVFEAALEFVANHKNLINRFLESEPNSVNAADRFLIAELKRIPLLGNLKMVEALLARPLSFSADDFKVNDFYNEGEVGTPRSVSERVKTTILSLETPDLLRFKDALRTTLSYLAVNDWLDACTILENSDERTSISPIFKAYFDFMKAKGYLSFIGG